MASCVDCKFRGFATSECHRHAPIILNGGTAWPIIADDNWCGDFVEFNENEDEDEDVTSASRPPALKETSNA